MGDSGKFLAPQTNGTNHRSRLDFSKNVDYAAIIIGAGFGGLRMIHEMRKLGLSMKVIEAGSDVGGTWYWNNYPGARTDSEGWCYILNFSKELKSDWVWTERYPTQGEVHRYLRHVADRFDMRKEIQFDTTIASAIFDEEKRTWILSTSEGEKLTCTFFIPATGVLSTAIQVPFPGLDSFKGKWYQASNWGKEPGDFLGKKVAIVGTGATGVQLVPAIAHSAASVHVFQRTPNYVLPGRNHPLTEDHLNEVKRNYDELWEQARTQVFGFPGMPHLGRTITNVVDEAEQQQILERGWESGGFRFVFATFDDILTDRRCNDIVSEFVRNKIRTLIRDKKTAELLCPDYPLLAKRPPLGHFYYEAYNRPNVHLVDISNESIKEITHNGLRTGTGEYEFDIIIFAIGFDAVTGALTNIDIRGQGNKSLKEQWNNSLETYLGITVRDFPNMFMVTGPQAPFANMPVVIDSTADWIGRAITHLGEENKTVMQVKTTAVNQWCDHVRATFESTLLASSSLKARSWYVGANVPGKPKSVLFYFGGLASYIVECDKEASAGFPGFEFSSS